MNFYAHLVTASWHSDDPAFALGAMLPDFATMANVRLPALGPGALADGVAFHHHSDKIFHEHPRFRSLESWTFRTMRDGGLRRGPARGVAHVGVELSLDGALVTSSEAHQLYEAAIAEAQNHRLRWESGESEARFTTLIERLIQIGVPMDYSKPTIVAERLVRIMKPRPLLRLSETDIPILYDVIGEVHKKVGSCAQALMLEM